MQSSKQVSSEEKNVVSGSATRHPVVQEKSQKRDSGTFQMEGGTQSFAMKEMQPKNHTELSVADTDSDDQATEGHPFLKKRAAKKQKSKRATQALSDVHKRCNPLIQLFWKVIAKFRPKKPTQSTTHFCLPYFSQCLFESSPKLSSQTREHYCIG
jgi:hypothetical protein